MSPQASIMTGTVQSVAPEGRPGHRPWRRSRELRASPEEMQELLLPTPVEMHKVGSGTQGAREAGAHVPMRPPLGPSPLQASFSSTSKTQE